MRRCAHIPNASILAAADYHRIYGNEHEVGQGIKDSGVPREDIFITSKLWNTHHANAKEGLQKTLDALGTDYLDLYVSMLSSYASIRSALTRLFSSSIGLSGW